MTISGTLQLTPALSQKNIKINIATPAYQGQYSSAYVRSLFSLTTSAQRVGLRYSFSDVDYSDIVVSRNYLISNFFFNKRDCSHLLFVDADMGFPVALISEMIDLNEDLVGALCQRRNINLESLHAATALPYKTALANACSFIGKPIKVHPRNSNFSLIQACGTGILLISRSCVETMIQKCPEILDTKRFRHFAFGHKFENFITPFNKITLEDRELSEDISFCHRWTKKCGGLIYVSTNHEIEHITSLSLKTCFNDKLQID